MMNDKKFKIANRISFVFFSLFLLTYIFLPIIERNAYYLIFLFVPFICSASLIINLLLKNNTMNKNNMKKISKMAAVLNILFNGTNTHTIASSSYVGTMDWDIKTEEIKKYPSITPIWLFLILLFTVFINGVSLLWTFSPTNSWNLSSNTITIASIISIIYILIGMISSSFALYYNNGKEETLGTWKLIIIVIIGLIIIIIFSAYLSGFSIRDEIRKKHDKITFEKHKQNIENTLNNN